MALCISSLVVPLCSCSTTASNHRALVGKWESSPRGGITYDFLPDGSYVYTQSSPELKASGRYKLENPNLVILTGFPGGTVAKQIVLEGDVLNEILGDGHLARFTRIAN